MRRIYGESGKSAVTFASVATRAGIGKPALYRRWATPRDLLMDALRAIPFPASIEDLGDAQAEFADYALELMRLLVAPDGAAMLRLLTEFHEDTEPFAELIAQVAGGMIAVAAHAVDRSVSRGEPRPRLSPQGVLEVLTGTMLSHTMVALRAGQVPPPQDAAEYCWNLAGLALGRTATGPADRGVPAPVTRGLPAGSRRDQLIRIAQDVVVRRGVAEVTLTDVAKSAGVTAPALYTHFSSRTELLEQVLEATARDYVVDLARTDDRDASVEQRLRLRLRRWAAVPAGRLRMIHDAVLHIPDSPRIKLAARRAGEAWDEFVADVLERGIACGEVRSDVDIDTAREILTTSLLGAEIGADTGLVDRSLPELSEHLADMFLAYVRPL